MASTKVNKLGEELVSVAGKGDLAKVRKLLDQGIDANYESAARNGVTALHEAARTSNAALVQLLLSKGADIDHQDNFRRTPLMLAVLASVRKPYDSDAEETVAQLLAAGPDVRITNKDGETALICAQHGRGEGLFGARAPQGKRQTQLDRIIDTLKKYEDQLSGGVH
jgi:ankyrin repeat protein